jgi:hypothetical protein
MPFSPRRGVRGKGETAQDGFQPAQNPHTPDQLLVGVCFCTAMLVTFSMMKTSMSNPAVLPTNSQP